MDEKQLYIFEIAFRQKKYLKNAKFVKSVN